MGLIRQKTTRWVGPDGRRCAPRTPGARKVVTESRKWYGEYRDENGDLVRVPLSANRAAAQIELGERMKRVELARVGVRDPFEGQRERPLTEHLADFLTELRTRPRGKGQPASPASLAETGARLTALFLGCEWTSPEEITLAGAQEWLASLRAGQTPPELPSGLNEWRPMEAAALLGLSAAEVTRLVRHHSLTVSGRGRGQRYPRSTMEALVGLVGRGVGDSTIGKYAATLKRFTRWLVRRKRLAEDPLIDLPGRTGESDHRHDRRALTLEELRRLLSATLASQKLWRGLAGKDRHALYLTACYTGYRALELSQLTPACFIFTDDDFLTVSLPGSATKNARAAVQPVPSAVAAGLRLYLADRPDHLPVWPGTWPGTAAQMLRRDLEVVGIPYAVEGPDGPLYADLHSLRHTYVALLEAAGVSVKLAMHLARHSDPKLTMARYGRPQLVDLQEAVERMPQSGTLGASSPVVVTVLVTGAGEGKGGEARATEGDTSAGKATRHRHKSSG